MQRVSVTLPNNVVEILNSQISKGERSKFIANAIMEVINKKKKLDALESLKNFTPFDIKKNSTEVLRTIRKSRQKNLAEKGN